MKPLNERMTNPSLMLRPSDDAAEGLSIEIQTSASPLSLNPVQDDAEQRVSIETAYNGAFSMMSGAVASLSPFEVAGDVNGGMSILKGETSNLKPFDGVVDDQDVSLPTSGEMSRLGRIVNSYPVGLPREPTETPDTNRDFGEGFVETSTNRLFYETSKGNVRLCNFILEVNRLVFIKYWGKREKTAAVEFVVRTEYKGSQPFTITCDCSGLGKLFNKIKEKSPGCMIFADLANAQARFAEYVSYKYAASEAAYPEDKRMTLFDISGWAEISPGTFRYLSADDENCLDTRKMPRGKEYDAKTYVAYGHHMLNVASPRVALPMFLHMHAGYLAALFQASGKPVQYIFNMAAKTGSFKSTLAEIFFLQFGVEMVNFTATDVAWELAALQGHDANIVLDDFHDTKSKALLEKFEKFQRQYCDSAPRAKSKNGGKEMEKKPLRCGVTLTSEATIDSMIESGKLRLACLQYDVQDINTGVLTELRNDIKTAKFKHEYSPVELYLACFIAFLEEHYTDLYDFSVHFEAPKIGLSAYRLHATFTVFCLCAKIVLKFWASTGFIQEEQCSTIYARWFEILKVWIQDNQMATTEQQPEAMYLRALSEGLATSAIKVAAEKDAFVRNTEAYIGYADEGILRLNSAQVYGHVVRFYQKRGMKFPVSESEILRALYSMGLTEGYAEKNRANRPYKKITVRGASIKTVNIYVEKMRSYLNN